MDIQQFILMFQKEVPFWLSVVSFHDLNTDFCHSSGELLEDVESITANYCVWEAFPGSRPAGFIRAGSKRPVLFPRIPWEGVKIIRQAQFFKTGCVFWMATTNKPADEEIAGALWAGIEQWHRCKASAGFEGFKMSRTGCPWLDLELKFLTDLMIVTMPAGSRSTLGPSPGCFCLFLPSYAPVLPNQSGPEKGVNGNKRWGWMISDPKKL